MGFSIKQYLKHRFTTTPIYANIVCLSPDEKLKDKRIVIVGGTGGIGQAMAKRFISEGARVLITGRHEEKVSQLAADLACDYLVLDLCKVELFEDFVQKAIEKLGSIDCLVNNAGVSLHESFQTVTPEGFDLQFATNLKGPFFLSQKVLPYMVANEIKGHILFISSETGETADIRPYGLTKAALNSLMQGLAYLYARRGIRVNAIAPGVTATNMTGFNPDENLKYMFNTSGRVYLPEEIAEVASYILSDASYSLSGQIITCNNARSLNVRWK